MCHLKTIDIIKKEQLVSLDHMHIYSLLVQVIHQLDILHNAIIQAKKHLKFCKCRVCVNLKQREATRVSAAYLYQCVEASYKRVTRPYLNRIILNL